MLFLNLMTALLVAVILWHMVGLQQLGRQLTAKRDASTLAKHRSKVACIGCLTVIVVVLIEAQVQMSAAPYASGTHLLVFHFVVVTMLILTFATIVLRMTGLRNPLWHRRLAYSFLTLYALAAATGFVMLYNLPGPA